MPLSGSLCVSMCLLVVALALLLCCYQVLPGAVVLLGVECHLSYHVVWQGQQPARQVWLPALPAKQPVGEGHAAVTECPLNIQGHSFVLATGCCVSSKSIDLFCTWPPRRAACCFQGTFKAHLCLVLVRSYGLVDIARTNDVAKNCHLTAPWLLQMPATCMDHTQRLGVGLPLIRSVDHMYLSSGKLQQQQTLVYQVRLGRLCGHGACFDCARHTSGMMGVFLRHTVCALCMSLHTGSVHVACCKAWLSMRSHRNPFCWGR